VFLKFAQSLKKTAWLPSVCIPCIFFSVHLYDLALNNFCFGNLFIVLRLCEIISCSAQVFVAGVQVYC